MAGLKTPEAWTFQSNFSNGEITPLFQARVDLQQYYKSLAIAKNVVNIPQGGMARRFGLDYVDTIAGITSYDEARLQSFEYSSSQQYVLVFIPLAILIYENDSLVASVVTPYTSGQIINLRFDQDLNSMIIVHPDVAPYQLSRGGNSATWNLSLFPFKNTPVFDFTNNYSAITFTLGATTGQNILLTASAPIFTADYVGGTFSSLPGTAKIISFTSSTQVMVNIYIDFSSTTVNGYEAILAEPAFSATRGWPQSVAFYQSRLFFGGTKSLPQGLFGSVLNQYNNFLTGVGLATDGIVLLLSGTRLNSIQYLLNAVSLFIFTTGGNYATQPLNTQTLTPSSASAAKQTSTGIQPQVPPFFIDSSVLYVQKGGRDIIKMDYSINYSSYKTTSMALTAENLIKNPVDASKFEHSQQNQGTYAYYCNGDALEFSPIGTLAILQIIDEENIQSWTWAESPNGKFRRTIGLDDSVYFLIEREVSGEIVFFLEKKNDSSLLDAQTYFTSMTPTNLINGLSNLEGEIVSVTSSGNYLGDYQVLSGSITISEEVTSAEVGYKWYPVIKTLPINMQTQQGNNLYQRKLARTTYIHLYQSKGVTINNITIPESIIGDQILGAPIYSLDGVYQIPTSFGWDWNQPMVISQNEPGPFTLLGVSYQTEY